MPVVTIGLDRDSQGPILKKSNGGIIRLDEDTAAYIRCLQDYARTAGPIPYDTPAVKSSSAAPKRDADFQSMSNGHFAEFIRRLRRHPEVIALLAQQPEIRLTIERPRVDWDAGSLAGRIALLVSEGFFKSPKAHVPILAECKRRQWVDQNSKGGAILYNQLNKLAEMGFLTVESDGYQSVPGMKIDVVRK